MSILVSLAAAVVAHPVQVSIVIVIGALSLVRLVRYAWLVATLIDRWLREVAPGRARLRRLLGVAAIVELPVLLLAIAASRGRTSQVLLLLLFASMAISGAGDLGAMIGRAARLRRAVAQ